MLQRLRQINDFRDLRTKNNMIYLFTFKMKSPRQMMELSPQLTQLLYLRDVIKLPSESGGNDACLLACSSCKAGQLDAASLPCTSLHVAPTFPKLGTQQRNNFSSYMLNHPKLLQVMPKLLWVLGN